MAGQGSDMKLNDYNGSRKLTTSIVSKDPINDMTKPAMKENVDGIYKYATKRGMDQKIVGLMKINWFCKRHVVGQDSTIKGD